MTHDALTVCGQDSNCATLFLANMRRSANVGSMLARRLRRWPNIELTLSERLLFAGLEHHRQFRPTLLPISIYTDNILNSTYLYT